MSYRELTQEELEKSAIKHIEKYEAGCTGVNKMIAIEYAGCSAEGRWLKMRHVVTSGEINPLGTVHGGVTAWLMDTALGMINVVFLCEGATPTINMSINYIDTIREGDELIITSYIDRIGGTIINTHGEISVNGKVKATAVGTSFRLHLTEND